MVPDGAAKIVIKYPILKLNLVKVPSEAVECHVDKVSPLCFWANQLDVSLLV